MYQSKTKLSGGGSRARDLAAALATGQLAGLAMLGVMTLHAVLGGVDPAEPLRTIGSVLYLQPEVQPGTLPVFLGFLLHQFGFSVLWSLIYASMVRFADRRHPWNVIALGFSGTWGTAALGLLIGMISQVADVLVGMPMVAGGAEWTHTFAGVGSWVYHLSYGAVLATFPLVRRTMFAEHPDLGAQTA